MNLLNKYLFLVEEADESDDEEDRTSAFKKSGAEPTPDISKFKVSNKNHFMFKFH